MPKGDSYSGSTRAEQTKVMTRYSDLGYATYNDYLQSNHWQTKKQEYVKVKGRQCKVCCTVFNCQLHHLNYERLGGELLSDLIMLCKKHHKVIHNSDNYRSLKCFYDTKEHNVFTARKKRIAKARRKLGS